MKGFILVMFQANKNSTSCKFADIEDFDEIQKLYWNLIEQSKGEPSFPGWKKGVHPSPEMIMESIKQKQMYILKANDVIKACAICNHFSNEEYANVSWRIKDTGENVCIIHALAVGYDYRGQGLGKILVNHIISDAKKSGSEAIHLDVIDNNVAAEAFYKGLGFQYISTENIFYEVVGHRNFKMYEYILSE